MELYNRYLPEDYPKILDYVRLTEKNVELVKSINEAKNIKTKEDDFAEKIKLGFNYKFIFGVFIALFLLLFT